MAGIPEIVPLPGSPGVESDATHAARPRLVGAGSLPAADTASVPHFSRALHDRSERFARSASKRLREALLLTFCDPIPKECLRLWLLTRAEWQQALHWLDVSGLALYFLDRIQQEDLCGLVPEPVLDRLRVNLADNRSRTAALIDDWTAIQRRFQTAGLSFATLKGFSLGAPSVPSLELRSQLDLDFLVAEANSAEARSILEERGFCLRAVSGRSWEFAANDSHAMTLGDLYKPTPNRYVELHIESAASPSPLLDRLSMRYLHGMYVPVLDPVDLFLGQGLHVFKHLCNEFTRTAHILEFRRHVMARSGDLAFWRRLRTRAEADPRHPIGLGVVNLLITRLMGDFAPPAFTTWTTDRLTPALRWWVDACGHDAVLADSSTKLYLLLQEGLVATGFSPRRSALEVLLPHRLPQPITVQAPQEDFASALRRRWRNLRHILRRARFHVIEGFHYFRAARRFHKRLATIR